ncbi:MAG: phosphotransferase [Thermodesulfobacteriota bacterium]
MAAFPRTRRLMEAVAELGATLSGVRTLAGDGSDRNFYRLVGNPPLVLLYHPLPPGPAVNENDSYYYLGRHLRIQGVPVPEIHVYCREEGWLLLEDLGDLSLEAAVKNFSGEETIRRWYGQALVVLLGMQLQGRESFDPDWCFDTPALDRAFLWERECTYFVQAFLQGYLGLEVGLADLASDFDRLLTGALPRESNYFLHRDFQSRNLFIKEDSLRVIDFQGGRLGPLGYDLAALLIDPYVALSPSRQETLLNDYLNLLKEQLPLDLREFREQYYHLALCRNLQILGAFGYLTRVKGKAYFAEFIPQALSALSRRLRERPGEFPRLEKVLAGIMG